MQIRPVTEADIPQWMSLSSEHDRYVKELVSDLTEWYGGNDREPSFDVYMKAKIAQSEAFMAVDTAGGCLGIAAFSRRNNRITFFGVTHKADMQSVGTALLACAFSRLDCTKPICTNEIDSTAMRIQQYRNLYASAGFSLSGKSFENGVPVDVFEKPPCS